MNNHAFYALHLSGNGHACLPWRVPSQDSFTISVRCLTDSSLSTGTLFSLSGLFSVGLSGAEICFEAGGQKKNVNVPVPVRSWNTVTLAYSGCRAKLYCNGILCLELPCQSAWLCGDKLTLGTGFSGCIQSVRLYGHCLTEKEICRSLLRKTADVLWEADFSTPDAPKDVDLSDCSVEKLVYTLDCRNGSLSGGLLQQPSGFTVLCTCYPLSNRFGEEKTTLLQMGDYFTLELCDSEGSNLFYPRFCLDGRTYSSFQMVEMEKWSDIAVTIAAEEDYYSMGFYVNGEKEDIEGIYIPDGRVQEIEFGSFCGYLDNCAVFGCALTPSQIKAYIANTPNVFEEGLLRLYRFFEHSWQECCTGGSLAAQGDAGYALISGAEADTPAPGPGCPGPVQKREYSAFAKWQIYYLIRILVLWVADTLGIYPNRGVRFQGEKMEVEETLYSFVYREIASLNEAQKVMGRYDHPDPQDFEKLIKKMMANGSMAKLLKYLYQDDDDQSSAYQPMMAILAAALAGAGTILANWLSESLAAALAAAGAEKPPNPPDDGSDDDDDEKKEKTYLSIRQVTLKGELDIKQSCSQHGDGNQQLAVFVLSQDQPAKLTVEIACKGQSGKFSLRAGQKQDGILQSADRDIWFTKGETETVTFEISLNRKDKRYGQYEDTLHWTAEGDTNTLFLGDTDHEIHFLEDTPREPWSSSTIDQECLQLSAECAKEAGEDSQGFLMDYLHWLQKYENVQSESQADLSELAPMSTTYWRRPDARLHKAAAFAADRFARDFLQRKKIGRDNLVISATVLGLLHGYRSRSVFINSGLDNYTFDNGRWIFNPCGLILKSTSVQGQAEPHVILVRDNKVYDFILNSFGLPFTSPGNEDLPFVGKSNPDTYRESIFCPGTCCRIQTYISNWELEDCAEETSSSTDVRCLDGGMPIEVEGLISSKGYFFYVRDKWDQTVRKHFDTRGGKHICHGISCYEISAALASQICEYRESSDLHLFESRLHDLVRALYPRALKAWEQEFLDNTNRLVSEFLRQLGESRRVNKEMLTHLCFTLSNSPGNLRLGDARWNSAIGAYYDPTDWFYVTASENGRLMKGSDPDGFPENLEELPGGLPVITQNGYFLPDPADGVRIGSLKNAQWEILLKPHVFYVNSDDGEAQTARHYLSSSSNKFNRDIDYMAETDYNEKIYYCYDNLWQEV